MWRLSFFIWSVANLSVLVVFCLALVPGVGLTAFLYSSLFSLPAVLGLYLLLSLLHLLRGHFVFSWVLMLAGTGLCSLLSFGLFQLFFSAGDEAGFVLPLCFVAGYVSVIAFSFPLQSMFLKFQYGND